MEEACGDCRFFKVTREREDGRLGECRLGKVMGVFREAMRACPSFARLGHDLPETSAASASRGVVRRTVGSPGLGSTHAPSRVSVSTVGSVLGGLAPDQLRTAIVQALAGAFLAQMPDLGRAWSSGELVLVPHDDELKAKPMPLDAYFHKLVMIRDNLRVMEQKINSHEHLQDAEKLDLQRRVTSAYVAVSRLGNAFTVRPDAGPTGEAQTVLQGLLLDAERETCAGPFPPMAERWLGGEVRFVRDGETLAESMEVFYHRISMVRDRLLSLEAQFGAHPHIAPDESDAMCAYVRRCYGSLTSFNLLFREREDYFTSSR